MNILIFFVIKFYYSVETQSQTMTFGHETGEYSSIYAANNYQSVDSKKFDQKLNIEQDETYAEIGVGNARIEVKNPPEIAKSDDPKTVLYASVDYKKKSKARLEKSSKVNEELANMNNLNLGNPKIYEDVEDQEKIANDDSNIYELVR